MSRHHEVVVIGAGVSGICAAIKLIEAGVEDVVIVEKADTFGGTWRANTYPGCACDVPSGLYSFSFAPNSEWSRLFATQPEILDYVDRVAREHGLAEHTRFGVTVEGSRFDDAAQLWRLETSEGPLSARFVVSAAGPWNEPRLPEIPGLAEFPGEVFHSARWNHDYDLRGKRVAVVGSGASAVQFVPAIQPEVAELHLFQRTAQWVLPKLDHRVPGFEKKVMRRFPFAHKALRSTEYALMEGLGVAFRHPRPLMQTVQAVGSAYLRAVVRDPALRAKLRPDYLLGCKRILFSNSYLQSLTKSNVDVHATGVAEFRGNTVVGVDGTTAEVDAVILGTGFHILDTPWPTSSAAPTAARWPSIGRVRPRPTSAPSPPVSPTRSPCSAPASAPATPRRSPSSKPRSPSSSRRSRAPGAKAGRGWMCVPTCRRATSIRCKPRWRAPSTTRAAATAITWMPTAATVSAGHGRPVSSPPVSVRSTPQTSPSPT